MNIHCSDRKKRAAEVWQQACILNRLLEIDLTRFPKGNVITKNSRQKRILSNGEKRIYKYHYQIVDVFGVGQFHLPVKNKDRYHNSEDSRWKLRDDIVYRNETEQRIEETSRHLMRAIKDLNSYKKSTEPLETYEKVMKEVKKAMRNRSTFEEEKKRTVKRLSNPHRDPTFDIDGLIVTDLGEGVRSKNECLFANKLNEMKVPYLYEMEVGKVGIPDFTVFINDKVYFIELFGMLDQTKYKQKQAEKIEKYSAMNIHVGESLVLIDVTRGIDMTILEKIVQGLIDGKVPKAAVRGYSMNAYHDKMTRLKEYENWCLSDVDD